MVTFQRYLILLMLIYFCVLSAYVESKNFTSIFTKLVVDNNLKETMSEVRGRIVRGQLAAVNQFPHQAFLLTKFVDGSAEYCGGSLLNQLWVLSAAHCFDKWVNNVEHLRIVLELNSRNPFRGAWSIAVQLGSIERSSGIFRSAIGLHVKDGYNRNTWTNDVALLKLNEWVDFSASVQQIWVEDKLYNLNGLVLRVSGFGRLNTNTDISQRLLYTDVKAISAAECQPYYSFPITSSLQCTQGFSNGGVCQGDR